jgi:hypothetical protein
MDRYANSNKKCRYGWIYGLMDEVASRWVGGGWMKGWRINASMHACMIE